MQRNDYLDILKGLAIIFVIANHTHAIGNESVQISSSIYWSTIIWSQLFKIAVPLFFAISGYLLATKDVSTWSLHSAFLRRQVPKVYFPMLIWSTPLLFHHIVAHGITWKGVGGFLVGGFSIYYFITAIMQFYLLLPLLQRMSRSNKGLAIAFIISMSCMAILDYVVDFRALGLPLVIYAGNFLVWLMFYVLGGWIRNRIIEKGVVLFNNNIVYLLYVITLLSFVLSIVDVHFRCISHGELTGVGIKNSSFLFSCFTLILLLGQASCLNIQGLKILKLIGRRSFGIYLIHCFIILILQKTLGMISLNINYLGLQVFLIMSTLLLSLLFIQGIRVLLKESKIIKLIGFF